MEKPIYEAWQESSASLAAVFKDIGDKNVAMTQDLVKNLASKQWVKMTEAAFEWTRELTHVTESGAALPKFSIPFDDYTRPARELGDIYRAAFEKVCESQFAMSNSTVELFSEYAKNLKKSRDIDDIVATNFDYLSNLMMAAKDGALDSLKVAEAIKTSLVAWTQNSLPAIESTETAPAPKPRGRTKAPAKTEPTPEPEPEETLTH